jgi:serine/threonine protein kinase/tetratricopeptide (TPR) repeat protein
VIGSQVGPFTIVSELGSGGMGTVYLGEGEGRKVAVKVVHPHLIATPGFFKRFLREAELGRKVEHGNVVRTLDVDATMVDGQQINYMIMEYVEGRSLRELLHDLGTVPETLLREIALQTAAGLAAIHAADIVHRDLKPENILITDDEVVRIMDLGVAKLQEASVALTREGQFAGSILYAAPEQFGKDPVGPSADLYSLGVLLYELATGQNPFRDDDAAAVIQAHLQLDPQRACECNPDISLFLSEVIGTLIAKAPADRLASSDALRKLLEEGEESEWWLERAQRLHATRSHLPRIQVPRETQLHARDGNLATLRDAWELAKQGQGSTLLFEGEAGIGKTRLVDEFVRSLGDEDCHVLYGSYPPSGGIGGFSDAILDKFGEAGLAQALRPYLRITPTLVPAFAALIKHEAQPAGSERLGGDAMSTIACHLMHALAEEKPTLWILDDIHFAPTESRQLLLAMARGLAAYRVLLVLTARSGVPDEDLAHLSRAPNFRRIALDRLSGRQIIELLRDAFKSEALAEKLGGKIAYKSDGVPFFVFEMIRGLKEGRFITQSDDGTYVQTEKITEIEVPSAVKDLIEARLGGLTREQRAILDVGAVQGSSFQPSLVAAVLEEKKVRVLQEVAEIERRLGLVRGERTSCRFDQNQVQEVLYRSLLPELRAEYHTMLADAAGENAEPAFLAHHYLRGSSPDQAKPHLEPALAQLSAGFRNEAYIELIDLALAAQGLLDEKERCDLLRRKAEMLILLGRRAEVDAVLAELIPLADATGSAKLRAEAKEQQGWHLWNLGRYEEAREALEEPLQVARDAGDEDLERAIATRLCAVLGMLGYHEQSLPLSHSPNASGLGLQYLGRYAEAHEQFDAALASGWNEGIARVNLGRLEAAMGNPLAGREQLQMSRELSRSVGQRRPESYALHRLGAVTEQLGETEEAERWYEEALALRREIQYPSGIADTQVALGRLRESRELLEEAVQIACEIDRVDPRVLGLVYLGDVPAAEDALRTYGDRMRMLDRTKAHFELWKQTAKPEHLEEAHRLHEYILEHAPEEARGSMIENVPLHREITEAWRDR